MRYVVTTRKDLGPDYDGGSAWVVTSPRRAVATLDEAKVGLRERIRRIRSQDAYIKLISHVESLPESGGTVGPLPDGTVIEVEPMRWTEMRDEADAWRDLDDDEIIAAYNAAQGVEA